MGHIIDLESAILNTVVDLMFRSDVAQTLNMQNDAAALFEKAERLAKWYTRVTGKPLFVGYMPLSELPSELPASRQNGVYVKE